MPIALLAMTISAFAIGTTEFVIVGLLPSVAADLQIGLPSAGLLVSLYALGVAMGAPVLTALTGRLPRKTLLLGLMALFTLGNLLAWQAPGYTSLVAARILTGLAHGVFFSIGSTIATGLVPKEKAASAIAIMFTGLTVALVTGVPLGTFIGQHFGWRETLLPLSAPGPPPCPSFTLVPSVPPAPSPKEKPARPVPALSAAFPVGLPTAAPLVPFMGAPCAGPNIFPALSAGGSTADPARKVSGQPKCW